MRTYGLLDLPMLTLRVHRVRFVRGGIVTIPELKLQKCPTRTFTPTLTPATPTPAIPTLTLASSYSYSYFYSYSYSYYYSCNYSYFYSYSTPRELGPQSLITTPNFPDPCFEVGPPESPGGGGWAIMIKLTPSQLGCDLHISLEPLRALRTPYEMGTCARIQTLNPKRVTLISTPISKILHVWVSYSSSP